MALLCAGVVLARFALLQEELREGLKLKSRLDVRDGWGRARVLTYSTYLLLVPYWISYDFEDI